MPKFLSKLLLVSLFFSCSNPRDKETITTLQTENDSLKNALEQYREKKEKNLQSNKKRTTTVVPTMFTGYQYVMNDDDYYSFKYTREYKQEGGVYKTVYKIYDPTKGHHAITVIAAHIKSEQKVRVDIEDAGGGIFAHVHDEETKYDTPSMESFGFRGDIGALGGNRVPNQLMVKFASNKFENVKVVHVNATAPGTSDFVFYVLDERN